MQASKANVVTKFHLRSLGIRNAELEYYLMVFGRMAEIASFLGGSASAALTIDISKDESLVLKATYLMVASSAFGAFLLVLIISAMCSMWGPGKALRGEDAAAMDYAIYILENAQRCAMRFFCFGLLCFLLAAFLLCWLLFKFKGSVWASAILAMMFLFLFQKGAIIFTVLNSGTSVSSALRGNLVKNVGELLGDRNLNAHAGVTTRFANKV